jgi:hypothetical protein
VQVAPQLGSIGILYFLRFPARWEISSTAVAMHLLMGVQGRQSAKYFLFDGIETYGDIITPQ